MSSKRTTSLCILLVLCFFAVGTAMALGPTNVDPISWQKAGAGLTFAPDSPSSVYGWTDSSGHGSDLMLIFGTQAPKYGAEKLNGQPVLGFGTGQGTSASNALFWQINPLHAAKAATGFVVVRVLDTAGGGNVWRLGSSNGENHWAALKHDGETPVPYVWENFGVVNKVLLINDKWMAGLQPPSPYISAPFVKFGEWYIYTVTIGPEKGDTVMKGYIDGILKGTAGGLTMGWAINPIIGDFGDAKSVMNVAEVLLYDRVLTEPEINAVVAYLGEKFGLCVAPPVFSVKGEVHNSPQTVTVSCATVGATIRYTTDGTDPSEKNGTVIASGRCIVIGSDAILKARAWKDGLPTSKINMAVYSFAPIPAKGLTAWSKAGFGLTFDPKHENWVKGWIDASGHGNSQLVGDWAGSPLYRPGELNGQPVLGFGKGRGTTSADELYYTGTYPNGKRGFIGSPFNPLGHAKAGTGFIVVRVFQNHKNPPYGGQVWDFGDFGPPNTWNPPAIYDDFGSTTKELLINDPTLQFGKWYIYAVTIGGNIGKAVMKGYINGVLKGTANGLTVSFYEVSVGDFNPVAKNETSVMDVAEILLYDRVLTDAEMRLVTSYLGHKFGIPTPKY